MLSLMVVATPVGWVGLIMGGLAVAGAAGAASIYTDKKAKENFGDIYDQVMDWMGS